MDRNGPPPPASAVPLPPPEHLQYPPNAATAAPKPGPGNTTLSQEEQGGGGGADEMSLPMKNFRTLLFKFIKPQTPSDESLIEQRLCDFFPAIHSVPDHPPYAAMIRRAIKELNKEGGSSEDAISEFIKNEYNHLPWAHPTLLAHHLHKLSEGGELVITCDQCYILRPAIINTTSNPRPIHSPHSNLIPNYSPCSTAFSSPCSSPISSPISSPSISPFSSPSSSSSSSDRPTPKRRLSQGRRRGRPRKWIQGQGRGRPRKVSDKDGEFKLNGKRREIQKRGRGRPRKSGQGRGRGRPHKKAETEEGYQLKKEEQTVVAEDHQMSEDENQHLGLETALKEYSQVTDMQVEEIKGKNVVEGLECQVLVVQNRGEEQRTIEAQGRGATEEWENHQKQENRITEVLIALEAPRNGLGNKKPEEQIEYIIDPNPLWKHEDVETGSAKQDQQAGLDIFITDQRDVVMLRSEAQDDGFFEEWNGKQKKGKGAIAEQSQSEDHEVVEEQNEYVEVIEQQDEQRKMEFEVTERQCHREKQENGVVQEVVLLEGDVSQGQCLEEEQRNEVVHEEVLLEIKVAEGQCQKEELKCELVQVEVQTKYKMVEGQDPGKDLQNKFALEEFQLYDKVAEEQQDVLMNISEQQRDVDVEDWNEEKELGKSGILKQNQSEAQENNGFQELILPQKRNLDEIIENVQLCKQQEKEILELDQLHIQTVEVPEELRQREENQVEMFQEEIQLEEEVLEEQRDIVIIRSEAVVDRVVERSTGLGKQVKEDIVDQNEREDQQNDAIGEQVQAQQISVVGIREKVQSFEPEESEEEHLLAKPEAEVSEWLHQQDEQQNAECSIDGTFKEQEDLENTISEAEEGRSTKEWNEEQKNEKGMQAAVNQLEEHENVCEEQTQAQEQCAGNKEKIQACELHEIIIMELKDRQEQVIDRKQHQEEELQVEAFEIRNQLQEKENVASSEGLQSLDVNRKELMALLCKSSWSLVEQERDEYLDRFRDKEMRSPCQEGEIPNSSNKWAQKQPDLPEIPLLESSMKCNQPLQERVQDEPIHPQFQLSRSEQATNASGADDGGNGRSPELKVCSPCVEGMRMHSRIANAAATSENQHGKGQPLRRSLRNLSADLEAAAKIEDLKHLKYPVKRPGHWRLPMPNISATDKVLRSGKRIKKVGQ